MLNKNVQIRMVQRAGAVDRYGAGLPETIYTRIFGYLDLTSGMARRADGDFQTISGTLVLDARYRLKERDIVTVESVEAPTFRVYDAQPDLDVHGQPIAYSHRLVQIVDTNPLGVPRA